MRLSIPCIVLAALGAGCSGPDHKLERRIADEVAKGGGTVVRMASLTDFSWDRLYLFEPYSSREDIERELGFAWPTADDTGIRDNEGIALLVFVKGSAVVRYVIQPRNQGDFGLDSRAFSSSEAVFVVTPRTDGDLVMAPIRTDGK